MTERINSSKSSDLPKNQLCRFLYSHNTDAMIYNPHNHKHNPELLLPIGEKWACLWRNFRRQPTQLKGQSFSWPLQSLQQSGRTHPLFMPDLPRTVHFIAKTPNLYVVRFLYSMFYSHVTIFWTTRMITVFQQITCIRIPLVPRFTAIIISAFTFLHHFANSLIQPGWVLYFSRQIQTPGPISTGPTPSSQNNWTQNCLPDNG